MSRDQFSSSLQQGYQLVAERMKSSTTQEFPVLLVFIDYEQKRLQIGLEKQAGVRLAEISRQLQTLLKDIPFEVGEAEIHDDVKRPQVPESERVQENKEVVRPVQGGTQIASQQDIGTLGLVVQRTDTNPPTTGFITAGHVMKPKLIGDYVGQPTYYDHEHIVGACSENGLQRTENKVDVAFVRLRDQEKPIPVIWVARGSPSIAVTDFLPKPAVGNDVTMFGSETGAPRMGQVRYLDVTKRGEGANYTIQVCLASYESLKGDSGAPVVYDAGDQGALLTGIHCGRVTHHGQEFACFTPMSEILAILPLVLKKSPASLD